jgi:hypothetical protein
MLAAGQREADFRKGCIYHYQMIHTNAECGGDVSDCNKDIAQ